jgi:hypothetical protein
MGNAPKAILVSFCLVNVPSIAFNVAVATAEIWCDNNIPLILGVLFQLMCNYFLFMASFTDPGIIPTVETSIDAPDSIIDDKYRHIKNKHERVFFLT